MIKNTDNPYSLETWDDEGGTRDPRDFEPKEEKACPRCKGTGLDRYEEEDCDYCAGAGTFCVAHSNPSTDCRRC
jgi:uncharacterized phage protein